MRQVIGLKQARTEIALDDSEDSPVYTLDFSDAAVSKSAKDLYNRYLLKQEALSRVSSGDASDADNAAAAELYQDVIESLLGKEAFAEIIAFVSDSKPSESPSADGLVYVLSPLVFYLLEQLSGVVSVNQSKLLRKYIDDDGDNVV